MIILQDLKIISFGNFKKPTLITNLSLFMEP